MRLLAGRPTTALEETTTAWGIKNSKGPAYCFCKPYVCNLHNLNVNSHDPFTVHLLYNFFACTRL